MHTMKYSFHISISINVFYYWLYMYIGCIYVCEYIMMLQYVYFNKCQTATINKTICAPLPIQLDPINSFVW